MLHVPVFQAQKSQKYFLIHHTRRLRSSLNEKSTLFYEDGLGPNENFFTESVKHKAINSYKSHCSGRGCIRH